jgi:hypothetical protein
VYCRSDLIAGGGKCSPSGFMVRRCGAFLWPSLTTKMYSGLVARVLPSATVLRVPVRVVDLGGSVLRRWLRGLGWWFGSDSAVVS